MRASGFEREHEVALEAWVSQQDPERLVKDTEEQSQASTGSEPGAEFVADDSVASDGQSQQSDEDRVGSRTQSPTLGELAGTKTTGDVMLGKT